MQYPSFINDFEKILRSYSPCKGVLSKLYSIILSVEQLIDWAKPEWELDLGEVTDQKFWENISLLVIIFLHMLVYKGTPWKCNTDYI